MEGTRKDLKNNDDIERLKKSYRASLEITKSSTILFLGDFINLSGDIQIDLLRGKLLRIAIAITELNTEGYIIFKKCKFDPSNLKLFKV